MTQEQFDDFLKRTLPDLDPVPPTPREEIWARIAQQRDFQKQVRRIEKKKTWWTWGVGLAAMLAIGIGLGRVSMLNNPERTAAAPAAAATTGVNRTAYRIAVAEHMTKAEALLTSFRTQPSGTSDPDLAIWASDLLTNTRLLLDSPAADDPKVAALLEDLELIIAQIALTSQGSSVQEQNIIRDGMKKTGVLPRIRATAGT